MSVYDYSFTDNNDNNVDLSQFKDHVLLLVNVASNCGFTSHYEGLQSLSKKYADKGLVVIGFPCNQFRQQEPGNAQEINEVCQLNYGVTFPMFDKVRVNGKHSSPIYQYLKQELPGFFGGFIKWNFTKFLIGRDG